MGLAGNMFVQISGYGVSGDARFSALGLDGLYNGTLDIRVFAAGNVTLIRVDTMGVTVMTPGNINLHASQNMTLSADGNMTLDCENLVVQGRLVLKESGGTI
jgi:hypothetical protein